MLVRIRYLAKTNKEWTLKQLADNWNERFPDNQITESTFYSWSNGKTQPKFDNMERLCYILDATMGEVFQAETAQFIIQSANLREPSNEQNK